jgi:hypothetical protein
MSRSVPVGATAWDPLALIAIVTEPVQPPAQLEKGHRDRASSSGGQTLSEQNCFARTRRTRRTQRLFAHHQDRKRVRHHLPSPRTPSRWWRRGRREFGCN